ncbi:MAG: type II toxin-antitoxin system Phd/YefM family antitoxin [bacterium]|nr:type II toxin-antitoxin system Phd/YefM family antitoxin [bacterium]
MDAKTTLSISEARKKIFKIAEMVQRPSVRYTLTDKGRPKAVIMSADEFESWQETLEVREEFPDLKKDIREADRAIETGGYKKWTSLDDIMAKYGYVLADKGKNKYGMGNKIRKRGGKRA